MALMSGATHVLQWSVQAQRTRGANRKAGLSTDCSLQLDCMKAESLVIADQQAAVNTFPGLVHTAVTPWESGAQKWLRKPQGSRSPRVLGNWGEVVTR